MEMENTVGGSRRMEARCRGVAGLCMGCSAEDAGDNVNYCNGKDKY